MTDWTGIAFQSRRVTFVLLTRRAVCLQTAALVFDLRQRWHGLFLRRIRSPSKPWSELDEATIRTVVLVRHTSIYCCIYCCCHVETS